MLNAVECTDMERSSPTVLVARTVKSGREVDFASWMTRVTNAAQRAAGHVAVDVQQPDSIHPDEWIVVYRFVDTDSLERWLSSEVREQLMAEGADLILGEAREQIFVTGSRGPGVRMVTSYLLKEGRAHEHRAVHEETINDLASHPGFQKREILDAIPGIQPETVVILTFDDEASLRRWLESGVRSQLLSRLDPHIEGAYTTNVLGGFAGWFAFDSAREPKRWKQAAVVLLALYPTVLLISYIRTLVWPGAPLVPAVFVGNVIGIAVLTWILMPPLTRRLSDWLRR